MSYSDIVTPRGSVTVGPFGKAELTWNPNFVAERNAKFGEAQKLVDSEVLRLCEPYTPMRTGMLIKSGTLGTVIGSGKVSWIAPYSRWQYYLVKRRASETGPLRGAMWFHRMKETHWRSIYKLALQKLTGGSE